MPDTAADPSGAADRSAPPPLLTAASLVLVEAAVLLGLAVMEMASLNSGRLTMGLTTALFFLAAAVGLAACARGLARRQRWGISPVMVAQLISLGLAWNLWGGQTKPFSVILAVLGVLVIAGIVHPASMAALEQDQP